MKMLIQVDTFIDSNDWNNHRGRRIKGVPYLLESVFALTLSYTNNARFDIHKCTHTLIYSVSLSVSTQMQKLQSN